MSSSTGRGVDEVMQVLQDKMSVVAGPSGVCVFVHVCVCARVLCCAVLCSYVDTRHTMHPIIPI